MAEEPFLQLELKRTANIRTFVFLPENCTLLLLFTFVFGLSEVQGLVSQSLSSVREGEGESAGDGESGEKEGERVRVKWR